MSSPRREDSGQVDSGRFVAAGLKSAGRGGEKEEPS